MIFSLQFSQLTNKFFLSLPLLDCPVRTNNNLLCLIETGYAEESVSTPYENLDPVHYNSCTNIMKQVASKHRNLFHSNTFLQSSTDQLDS